MYGTKGSRVLPVDGGACCEEIQAESYQKDCSTDYHRVFVHIIMVGKKEKTFRCDFNQLPAGVFRKSGLKGGWSLPAIEHHPHIRR
jgi:hypothetical protein